MLTGLAATIRYVVGEGELALPDGRGGSLGGTTGCRDLTGSYPLEEGDGSRLEIRPDTTGTGTCSPEQTEVGADLLAALTAATTYRISGNKLTLRDDAGSTQVTLLRR